jgi:hypothetical protein
MRLTRCQRGIFLKPAAPPRVSATKDLIRGRLALACSHICSVAYPVLDATGELEAYRSSWRSPRRPRHGHDRIRQQYCHANLLQSRSSALPSAHEVD